MSLKVYMQSGMSPAYSNQDVGSKKSNVNLKTGGFDAPILKLTRNFVKEAVYVGKQAFHIVEKGFDAATDIAGDIAKESIPKMLAEESRKNAATSRLLRSGGGGGAIGWSFTMFEK